ncbi:MAG: hypothetical protein Q9227_005584 [Pyrenula ochraceoflavens]
MEAPPFAVLVFFFLFFVLSPGTQGPTPNQRAEFDVRVAQQWQALHMFQNASYGDFRPQDGSWLNTTGFRKEDDFAWDVLLQARKTARKQFLQLKRAAQEASDEDVTKATEPRYDELHKHLPVFQNVTSWVYGKFVRQRFETGIRDKVNLTALAPGTDYATRNFNRNITEDEGEIRLHLDESSARDYGNGVRPIKADLAIFTSSSPGNGWRMRLYGLHDQPTGSIILSTSSEKFGGIFALPHLTLTGSGFASAKETLIQYLSNSIQTWADSGSFESRSPWSSQAIEGSELFSIPSCEYVVYLQQHPIASSQNVIAMVESELRFHKGLPLPPVPPVVMSATLFSPDCAFILESQGPPAYPSKDVFHLEGPKIEILWWLRRKLIIATAVLICMQLALLKRQVDEASTPSTRSRISLETLTIVAMGDSLMLSSLVVTSMQLLSASLVLMAAAFACFMNFTFSIRFIFEIWTVQVGDPRQREIERYRAQVRARNTPRELPQPATAPRADTGAAPIPVILPPDQDIEAAAAQDAQPQSLNAHFTMLFGRFYFTMAMLMLVSIWAFSWPRFLRSVYTNTLCFLYLSHWVPQIYRNTMRNCRQALRWEFVFGSSILRIAPIFYCYMKKDNTLFVTSDPVAGFLLLGWLWLQVMVLLSQQFLGPRLLVKESWCPPAYDYHPLLRDGADPEAGSLLPVGTVASASEAKDARDLPKEKDRKEGNKIFDCAICMQEIAVPVVGGNDSSSGATWLGRMMYMVTPCRHIFHSGCLEEWMKSRLVCPICREGLPPT